MSVILFSNCVMLPVNYNICYNIAVSQHGNSMQKVRRVFKTPFHNAYQPTHYIVVNFNIYTVNVVLYSY